MAWHCEVHCHRHMKVSLRRVATTRLSVDMKFTVKYILAAILFGLFLREAWFTISKYREANTFLRVL